MKLAWVFQIVGWVALAVATVVVFHPRPPASTPQPIELRTVDGKWVKCVGRKCVPLFSGKLHVVVWRGGRSEICDEQEQFCSPVTRTR